METPASPATAPSGPLFALLREQRRMLGRILHLPRVVALARKTRVGTTPADVVFEKRTLRLLRYRRETPATRSAPILLCYALINRPYILDLQPERSVVRRYLEQGFEVYLIDWGIPTAEARGLTLHDYVEVFLKEAVDFILHRCARRDLNLLGYCMGGTMAALFTALNPRLVRTLTLLAAPIDFGGRESLLNLWADAQHFDVDDFIDTHGNCPAWFLQSCFTQLAPVQNSIAKGSAFYDQMDDDRFLSSYFAMERWLGDNIPVAGETFRAFVKQLYQRNQLVRGELRVGERLVELGQIVCPLLLLTASKDHLVAPSSTEGLRPHVGSTDITSLAMDGGHVGLVVSDKAQRTLWPQATRWLAERSDSQLC